MWLPRMGGFTNVKSISRALMNTEHFLFLPNALSERYKLYEEEWFISPPVMVKANGKHGECLNFVTSLWPSWALRLLQARKHIASIWAPTEWSDTSSKTASRIWWCHLVRINPPPPPSTFMLLWQCVSLSLLPDVLQNLCVTHDHGWAESRDISIYSASVRFLCTFIVIAIPPFCKRT